MLLIFVFCKRYIYSFSHVYMSFRRFLKSFYKVSFQILSSNQGMASEANTYAKPAIHLSALTLNSLD